MSEDILTNTFTRLRQRFRLSAMHFLHSEEEADDALQEAFCRLWPRRDVIATVQEAEALSATTVRNLCIDTVRRQQRTSVVSIDEERDTGPTETLSDAMERHERFRQVEQIIEQNLTPLQQSILHKKEYDGENLKQIAQELNMQPPAVAMQLSRARKTIREHYQKLQEHET